MRIFSAMAEQRSSGVLIGIGIFKLVKVVILLVAGFAAVELLHRDPQSELWRWIEHFNINPTQPIIERALGKASDVDSAELWKVIVTAFTYAVLLSIEGIGLLLKKHWAEYFTVFITGSLLPFEIWELHKGLTATRVIALIVNVAIVVYLIVRLVKQRHDKKRPRAGALRPSHA
jgi:uncharacterized membrane protein (DUF2068 family)